MRIAALTCGNFSKLEHVRAECLVSHVSVNMHDLQFYLHTIQLSGSRKGEARVCLPPQRPKEGGEAKMGLLQLTEILPFLQRLPTIEHVCAREILCENPAVSKTLTCSNDNYLYVPAP